MSLFRQPMNERRSVPRIVTELRTKKIAFVLFVVSMGGGTRAAQSVAPLLLRDPTVSGTQVAFGYAGFIWTSSANGTHLRQLTRGGHEESPHFSPDGVSIAFTGQFDGERAVYVIPSRGGIPTRLTFHPADIGPVGWTPDGKSVLFASGRDAFAPWADENMRLYSVPREGGPAAPLPFHRASAGSMSPDEKLIAYIPNVAWQHFQDGWKHYRGGQTQPIWIARLSDSSLEEKIPRDNSNDFDPMWIGDTIYFLSDRAGPVTLFAYDLKSKQVRQVIENHGFDIKSASASGRRIIYEQFGSLHVLDLKSGNDSALDIRPDGDFPEVRPHPVDLDPKNVRSAAISPAGDRTAFGIHGHIVTVDVSEGTVASLTGSVPVSEIYPAWSPDGKRIAYFSDYSGAYDLHIKNIAQPQEVHSFSLGDPLAFYYTPVWSPDSRKIAYTDQHLNFWYLNVDTGQPIKIDSDLFAGPDHCKGIVWSPDSRWAAYTKLLPSHLHAIFLYSLAQAKSYQITDGRTDAVQPAFDPSGGALYFTASSPGLASGWTDLSSWERPVRRSVYAVALNEEGATKLAAIALSTPFSTMDEKTLVKEAGERHGTQLSDGTQQRPWRLPIPDGNYQVIQIGAPDSLYVLEAPPVLGPPEDVTKFKVWRFDLSTSHLQDVFDQVSEFQVSADGKTALYEKDQHWFAEPPGREPGSSVSIQALRLDKAVIEIDPRREWRHIFDQVWRDERSFFYDPNLHGLDWETTRARYEPFLDQLSSRQDLNYLLLEMLGNLTVGHMHARGGDIPKVEHKTPVGLLGADYSMEHGRYRIVKIYPTDPWDPNLRSPLNEPGSEVVEGEYVLAVNGVEVRATADYYQYFQGCAAKPTRLTVGRYPDGRDSRTVTVVPLTEDATLRHLAWVAKNRRTVEAMTGGRVAYVEVPDTNARGYLSFNQEYFAQVGKKAVILDVRFNHGGNIADYMINVMARPLRSYWHLREGMDLTEPMEGIFGPKVMLINEMTGSGGDAFAWLFRDTKVGPLIGSRTWGGLIGTYAGPNDLLDGGYVATPNLAFYNREQAWEIENRGISPDIEVEDDPRAERLGHDPQLERAIEVVMGMLAKEGVNEAAKHPPYPKYH
jgi:tricorn protease